MVTLELAAAALVAVLSGAISSDAASPAAALGPFAGLPDIRFVYRPIGGASVGELADALVASAAHPPGGGLSFADTRWSIHWHWRGGGRICRVTSVEMTFGADVTLPRLTDPGALDAPTRARWNAFERAIALHEAGHARRAFDHVPRVRRAILGRRCDDADAAGRAALRLLNAAQAAYDRATRNGAAQGAHFP